MSEIERKKTMIITKMNTESGSGSNVNKSIIERATKHVCISECSHASYIETCFLVPMSDICERGL